MDSLKGGTPVTGGTVYGFGDYLLDTSARRLTRAGDAIALPPKSYEVLVLLVTNHGRAMARDEIVSAVWPDTFVEAGNLDWHVSTLRKALAESRGAIETVRGFGYRFTPEVLRETASGGMRAVLEPEPVPAVVPVPPALPARAAPATAPRSRRWWGLAAGLAAAAGFAWLSARSGQRARVTRPPTVAVLAFENLSGNAENAWLSLALRELLAAELSQSSNVTMIPGETVARAIQDLKMKGGTLGPDTLGRLRQSLGTDVVVSGSYVVVGRERNVRIVSSLQDCVSAQTLATVEQNGTVDDVLAVVSQIGTRLRSPFEARDPSLKAQQGGGFATSAEVLRLYMEGLGRLRELKTLEAKDLLLRATELDKSFALAHSALAEAWGDLGYERKAGEEAKLAVEQSASLSREDRLLIEGRREELANRWERAAEVYQALVTFFPESVDYGLKLANALTRAKRAREALRTLDRLRRFPEPKGGDPRIDVARGWAARWLGDFAGMEAAGREAERKGRGSARPHLIAQGLYLRAWAGITLFHSEDAEATTREGARVAQETGDLGLAASHLSVRGYALSQLARFEDARGAFEEGLDVARRIGSMQNVRSLLSGLSQLELDLGRPADAERTAREGVDVCRTTGDAEGEVSALLDLSRVVRAKGDLASAKALAMEGLEKAREVGLDSRVSNAQLELGEAELLEGNLTAARAAFSESLRLRAGTAGARTAFVRVRLARAALEGGDAAAALEMARAAVAEAPGSTDAHQALAEALAASSDPGAKPEFDVADGLSRKGTSFRDVLEGDLWRGRCLARLGLSTDARRALTRAEKAAAEHGFAAAALEARQRLARLGRAP